MSKGTSSRSPWLILFIVLLASVTASMSQFKVPPVLPLLMRAFSESPGSAGLLMSVFAVTGLFMAIPSGLILQKWGYAATGWTAIFCLILGAGMGALSKGVGIMLASRLIEGAGMSFMAVLAPAIIALGFTEERRGKAMGIWSVWLPLGSTIMFLIAPLLAAYWGWRGVWWFGFFFTIAVGIFFYLFVASNPRPHSDPGNLSPTRGRMRAGFHAVLRNRDLWRISLLFGCFNFVFVGFITWAPTFLNQRRHVSMAHAALLVSLTTMISMAAGPIAGWISDRIGSRKGICAIPPILMAFLFPLSFSAGESLFFLLAVAIGFLAGFVPTGVFSAGVEVVGDEQLAGMAMAVIQIGQNSGMLLGPLVLGWVAESFGWQTAFWSLTPVSVLGGISAWTARIR
jgi:MFS family permease